MTSSIGLDIGGAHLKACLIRDDTSLKLSKVDLFKTPIWGIAKCSRIYFKGDRKEMVHRRRYSDKHYNDCRNDRLL